MFFCHKFIKIDLSLFCNVNGKYLSKIKSKPILKRKLLNKSYFAYKRHLKEIVKVYANFSKKLDEQAKFSFLSYRF